jgi:hypothetical protein
VHTPRHILPLLLVVAAAAGGAAFAGCGDDPPSESDKVADTVTRAYTESDPDLCTELLTPNFIKTSAYKTVETCRRTATIGANASSVDVLDVRIDGEKATALVAALGGSSSAKPELLRLVKQEGEWKIDGFGKFGG